MPSGRVVWVTGLSGSGKTTVGRLLYSRLRERGRFAVLLDGDELRRTVARDLGYTLSARARCADRYARLARLLAQQGLDVVVATISMFDAVRRWNRRHAPGYVEVYLRVPQSIRLRRNRRHVQPVVGRELPFEEPRRPDLIFADLSLTPHDIVRQTLSYLDRAPADSRRGR